MENEEVSIKPKYKGIGGWLILIVIGLIVTVFVFLCNVYYGLTVDLPDNWLKSTTPSSNDYHPLKGPFLIFTLVMNIFMTIVPTILLVLMFQKSRLFPKAMIIYFYSTVVWNLTGEFLSYMINDYYLDVEEVVGLLLSVGSAAIWIRYFYVSKRVKATFLTATITESKKSYKGIGGWLILIMIGLILKIIITLNFTYNDLQNTHNNWHEITTPGSKYYHTLMEPYLIFLLIFYISLVIVPVFLLVLLFRKNYLFPKAMIIFLYSDAVLELIILVFRLIIYTDIDIYTFLKLAFSIIAPVIWVPYFHLSKRVKATFLNVNNENKTKTTTDTTSHP